VLRKRVSVLVAAALMAALMMMMAAPAFAAGDFKQTNCEEGVTLPTTGVTGTLCESFLFTPSGNENQQQHFKPDEQQHGDVLEGGALQESFIVPSEQTTHIVFTPSGNAAVHNNFH
jgi:hypothetical protein